MSADAPKPTPKVGILTAGGLAPCLSSAVGYLIEKVGVNKYLIRILLSVCNFTCR